MSGKGLSIATLLTPLNNTHKTHLNSYNMIEELLEAFQKGRTLHDRDELVQKMKECLEERNKNVEKRADAMSLDLRGVVALLIYMQGDGGVLSRSPQYILEKAKRCLGNRHQRDFGLDHHRHELMGQWIAKWDPKSTSPKHWSDGEDDYRR